MVKSDIYLEIKRHVDKIRLVDTHEHLPQENTRIGMEVDALSELFLHYSSSDLRSAGMKEEEIITIRDISIAIDERWSII